MRERLRMTALSHSPTPPARCIVPTPVSGVAGMSMCSTPSGRSASRIGIDDGRRRADRAGLADALDAERIGLGRDLLQRRLELREACRARGMA